MPHRCCPLTYVPYSFIFLKIGHWLTPKFRWQILTTDVFQHLLWLSITVLSPKLGDNSVTIANEICHQNFGDKLLPFGHRIKLVVEASITKSFGYKFWCQTPFCHRTSEPTVKKLLFLRILSPNIYTFPRIEISVLSLSILYPFHLSYFVFRTSARREDEQATIFYN